MRVLILPGLDGTGRLLGAFTAALPESLGALVARYPPDEPRGYGELDQLVDAARPAGERLVIIAESFSGPLALRAASARPDGIAGIALVASFIQSPIPFATALSRLVGTALPRLAMRRPLIRHFLAGSDAPQDLVDELAAIVAGIRPDVLLARVRAILDVDARAALRACPAPIIYLSGTRDRLVGKRARDALLAVRADIPVVPIDAPHLVLQRQPAAAAQAIAAFCEGLA